MTTTRFLPVQVRRALLPFLFAREELQYRLIRAGVPALLIGTDLRLLPEVFADAQDAMGDHWTDFLRAGHIGWLLKAAEYEARLCWAQD